MKISKWKKQKNDLLAKRVRELYRTGLTIRQVEVLILGKKSRGWIGQVVKNMDKT